MRSSDLNGGSTGMQSGKYRHQVILLRRSDNQTGSGQVKFDYVEVATVWARIMPITGREYFSAKQVQSEGQLKIAIRWRDDVDETWRVRHITDNSVSPPLYDEFDIKSPPIADEKTGRRELMLMCEKSIAEGFRG
jgi:SPP1 family predicted phage head-tail adaptor